MTIHNAKCKYGKRLNDEFSETDEMSVDITQSGWQQIVDYLIDFEIERTYGLAGRNVDLEFTETALCRRTFGQCSCRCVCREVILSGCENIVGCAGNFSAAAARQNCGFDFRLVLMNLLSEQIICYIRQIICHISKCGADNAQECYDQQSVLHNF